MNILNNSGFFVRVPTYKRANQVKDRQKEIFFEMIIVWQRNSYIKSTVLSD